MNKTNHWKNFWKEYIENEKELYVIFLDNVNWCDILDIIYTFLYLIFSFILTPVSFILYLIDYISENRKEKKSE